MDDVILRNWKREDAQPLATIANNKNIWLNVRDAFPHPYTVMDAIKWINDCADKQPVTNFCIAYQGKVAGSIGIITKADVYRKSLEIGYFIGEPYQGRGIATKATAILLQYIQQQFDVVRIYAEVFEHNKASMKVLQKNGFHLEGIRQKAVIKNGIIMDDYVWVKLVNMV